MRVDVIRVFFGPFLFISRWPHGNLMLSVFPGGLARISHVRANKRAIYEKIPLCGIKKYILLG